MKAIIKTSCCFCIKFLTISYTDANIIKTRYAVSGKVSTKRGWPKEMVVDLTNEDYIRIYMQCQVRFGQNEVAQSNGCGSH